MHKPHLSINPKAGEMQEGVMITMESPHSVRKNSTKHKSTNMTLLQTIPLQHCRCFFIHQSKHKTRADEVILVADFAENQWKSTFGEKHVSRIFDLRTDG
jgi:hypothetical protein